MKGGILIVVGTILGIVLFAAMFPNILTAIGNIRYGTVNVSNYIAFDTILSIAPTLFWLGGLNLQAGYWDVFWPQFVQGIALGLLFVPLTTLTMAPIPRERMGNATSLFNLMRNIGGSVGIAITATLLTTRQEVHRQILSEHVNLYNPAAQQAFNGLKSGFMARGADAFTATQQAYAAMSGMVMRQGSSNSVRRLSERTFCSFATSRTVLPDL